MTDYKGMLQDAIYAYEARVGDFLSSGKVVSDLRNRAQAYMNAGDSLIKGKAVGVVDKAMGLLDTFNSIQSSAISTAQAASSLKNQMDSDPQWRAILSADLSVLGWETAQAAARMFGQVTSVVADLAAVVSRIDDYMGQVDTLKSDVSDLDSYAQGKGVTRRLDSLFTSADSNVKWGIAALAVVAAVVYGGPALVMSARRRSRA